jgi:hypothetical protein
MTDPVPGTLNFADTRRWLDQHRDRLPMFIVTDHPSDCPDFYCARLHFTLGDRQGATEFAILDINLDRLRESLAGLGFVKLDRDPSDDPVILESWI